MMQTHLKDKEAALQKQSAEDENFGELIQYKTRRGLRFHAVLAQSLNGVIGQESGLPWHEPEDLKSFMKITKGGWVIMGRCTWDSLKGSLPNRQSLVLSRNEKLHLPEGIFLASNWKAAMKMLPENTKAFVIGGAQIYRSSLPLLDEIWVTLVKLVCSGDACFNAFTSINPLEWEVLEQRVLSPRSELFVLRRKA